MSHILQRRFSTTPGTQPKHGSPQQVARSAGVKKTSMGHVVWVICEMERAGGWNGSENTQETRLHRSPPAMLKSPKATLEETSWRALVTG